MGQGLMGDIRVRKLDEWVVTWFRAQAKQHGRSLESEFREMLTDAVRQRKKEIAAELRADLKELEDKHGLFSDSTKLIREERERLG
jgi:plasmid stability protein